MTNPSTPAAEDEFTELFDGQVPRVDLVGKGANGMPFLIAKSDQQATGLLPAALVSSLIGEPETPIEKGHDPVTITGSPAAIAEMIAKAPVRKSDAAAVVKDDDPTDLTEPLADADTVAEDAADKLLVEGDPDDPASAAWEAVDAARAQQGLDLALGLKRLLEQAGARESQEGAAPSGDNEDIENAWNLDDACCALDYIVGILAPFAVGEQAEAADRIAAREALMSGQVQKAGRVLSASNETAIRSAAASLQNVLATLPAPIPDDGGQVAKEDSMDTTTDATPAAGATAAPADEVTKNATDTAAEQPTEDAAEVEKAKGDPQVAVYDSSGNLIGTVDQADLTPLKDASSPAEGDDVAPADPAATPAAASTADLQAAPPADAGVVKDTEPSSGDAPSTLNTEEVLKGIIDSKVEAALKDHPVVKALETEIENLKAHAPSKVVTNGQTPPERLLRGHGAGNTTAVTVEKAQDLRRQLDAASTVAEREKVAKEMQGNASALIAALRAQSQSDRARQ